MTVLKRPVSRWLLPLSLSLNVFLVSWQAAHHLLRRGGPPPPGEIVERLAEGLPEQDGEKLRQAFKQADQQFGRDNAHIRETEDQMRKAMAAEPFDLDAFRTAVEQTIAAHHAVGHGLAGLMLQVVPELSPAGRRKLSQFHGPPPGMPPDGPNGPPPGPRPPGPPPF